MMKKIIALILTGMMILSIAACGAAKAPESAAAENTEENSIVGGYERTDSTEVTEEIRALVEKATEKMVGAEYEPVAYVAKQIVSGTNHRILCRVKAVTPDAAAKYALVTIYEDLQGNAEIKEVLESDAEAGAPDLLGGWQTPETPAMTEEASAALEKATEKLLGAEYTPEALVATQVVSGTNYCILCTVRPVSPKGEPSYNLVYVYRDLKGNAEIKDTVEFHA
ncbi:MAG: hypothetical protein IJJ50_00305 [Lachnospiraceae bacterium]|nr:hypothetical protein [Lachnospiraceae bacterium]